MDNIYQYGENDVHPSAIIEAGAILGTGNTIKEGVIIRAGVQIGDNNHVGPYCIIGDNAEKVGFFNKPGLVIIGSGNRFTKQITIDAGTERPTIIKNNTILLKNAHVGHDAVIKDGVTLSCNVCIGGFTEVGDRTNFGLGAVAHQRLVIPSDIMVGMNTTITKKTHLEPNRKYVGSPARDMGENKK
jgi:UDP-N-acetylglucosamine acyltransferase